MDFRYLERLPFAAALKHEQDAFATVQAGVPGIVLGFETEPVVTLGVRSGSADLLHSDELLTERGFDLVTVERGGQATLHNPGQLVIFPIVPIRHIGVRVWIERLSEVTRACLNEWNIPTRWDAKRPGLYTASGKIMSCGVRIKKGISTHGISINVHNRLSDFNLIRSCGVNGAEIDRMGEGISTAEVFRVWSEKFRHAHS